MDQVSVVREKVDIVGLLQEYITLKRAGRNFKANCPFHGDKSPSFMVSPERQMWHCFGCQKGGDAFTFLMEYEHMEFPEALRFLADRVGVKLENQKYDSAALSKKEKIYALNHLAAEFYHYLLTKHEVGKQALEYVQKRNIRTATMDTYMLGFSPRSGNALVTYLIGKKHYKKEDLLDAGLATPRGREVVDFFQGRLMFPLYDHRGNVIGFSGRVLNATEKTSKYINTRETLVYHKGLTFFGLNSAKESIKKENAAILVEGEFDVISSFQEGITNVVAVKGTALTEDQVNLLSRFCQKVALCFDMDRAGQDAMKRSVPILEKKGMSATVLVVPGGKDADEAIQTDPIAFKKAIKNDIPVYDFLIDSAIRSYGVNTSLGKKQVGDDILPLLAHVENEIVKEHYLQLLGRKLNTSYEALVKALEKVKKKEIVKREVVSAVIPQSREEKMELYILSLFVQHPRPLTLLEQEKEFLLSYTWRNPPYQKILSHIQKYFEAKPEGALQEAIPSLPQELLPSFDSAFLFPLPPLPDGKWEEEVKKTARDLQMLFVREKIKSLSEEIKVKEKDGTPEELAALQSDFSRYVALLKG